jgi:hypothetical protein
VCLDTAFHADLPPAAHTYALPGEWTERLGLRRYGFHGLSYAWALRRAAELLDRPAASLHVVLAHLGGGCSVCAVRDGRSVDTTMGFTPLDVLVMSKRSGSVDPGLLLWLQTSAGLKAERLEEAFNHESGLLGLSGTSGDTRDLVRARAEGDAKAAFALEVFTVSVRRGIASVAASLDRIDALVFTGEIGVDQPEVREAVCSGLGVLGIAGNLTEGNPPDCAVISPPGGDSCAEQGARVSGPCLRATRLLFPVWALVWGLAGCGSAGERAADASSAARAFERDLGEGDRAGICAALAPETRGEVEESGKKACVDGIRGQDLPAGGPVRSVDVYGRQARAVLASDTLFLSQFPGGWKIVAAGCRPRSGQPYQCSLKGG